MHAVITNNDDMQKTFAHDDLTIELAEKRTSGAEVYRMKNSKLRVMVSNLGCRVLSIEMKEADGGYKEVILRPKNPDHPEEDGSYMGSVIGRVANRISDGKFTLNGRKYTLKTNEGRNHLHGGESGFDCRFFAPKIEEDGIVFSYDSPDMEEGYPGNLHVDVKYVLRGGTFGIVYSGYSDADTILNLTNHMYFNLSGGGTVLGHRLQIKADRFMPVDDDCLVKGEFAETGGTVFDFSEPAVIGERMDMNEPEIRKAHGFDHAFVLAASSDQVLLADEASGRQLVISTDMPMVHVYTGNYLSVSAAGGIDNKASEDGKYYKDYEGIALETEFCPNSINVEKDPAVILRKGDTYHSETYYTFR